jgi:hypothetical protein
MTDQLSHKAASALMLALGCMRLSQSVAFKVWRSCLVLWLDMVACPARRDPTV